MSAPRPRSQDRQPAADPSHASSEDAAWFGQLAPWALFAMIFLMGIFPLRDTDFFWHLKTGELIWQKMTIPTHDWFTYMDADRPWIDLHWGFQLFITAIYSLAGPNGIILVKSLVYTLAVFIGWNAAGRNLPIWQRILIWFPAGVAIAGRAYERPEMFTLLFLACFLWLIERVPSQSRWLWAFPVVTLVWVNFHALFILGFVVWGAFLADNVAGQIKPLQRLGLTPLWPHPQWLLLAAVSFLILAAAFINPYFTQGVLFPFELFRKFSVENDFYGPRIAEFNPPWMFVTSLIKKYGPQYGLVMSFMNLYFTAQLATFFVAFPTFLLLLSRRQAVLYRWLLFLGFSYLGWVAVRNVSVFALVLAVISSANLEQWHKTGPAPHPGKSPAVFPNQFATILLGLTILFYVSGQWAEYVERWKRFGLGEAAGWYGHDVMKFAGRPGMPSRAFLAHIGLAGTYIYHNGPERKVFMDPRLEVGSRQTFVKFEEVEVLLSKGQPGWEKIVNPDGKELPAVILDSRLSRFMINQLLQNPDWRLVFADGSAGLFIPAPLADKLNLPLADQTPMFKPPD